MTCYLVSCKDYKVIRRVVVNDFSELPQLCIEEMDRADDDKAVLASHNGQFVADFEGVYERVNQRECEGYSHACGYHD